jgi:hypothetical protein
MIPLYRDTQSEFQKLAQQAVRNVVFQFERQAIIAGPAGTGRFTIARLELERHDQPLNISRPYINGRSMENELAYMDRAVEANEILLVDIEDEDRIPNVIFVKLLEIVRSGASVVIIRDEDLGISGHPRVTMKEELMNPIWRTVPHYVSYYEIDRKLRLPTQA